MFEKIDRRAWRKNLGTRTARRTGTKNGPRKDGKKGGPRQAPNARPSERLSESIKLARQMMASKPQKATAWAAATSRPIVAR